MALRDALSLARERNLDLVEIASTAEATVCQILNYGKLKYETDLQIRTVQRQAKAILRGAAPPDSDAISAGRDRRRRK